MITDKCGGRIIGITKRNGDKINGRIVSFNSDKVIIFDNNRKKERSISQASIVEINGRPETKRTHSNKY